METVHMIHGREIYKYHGIVTIFFLWINYQALMFWPNSTNQQGASMLSILFQK